MLSSQAVAYVSHLCCSAAFTTDTTAYACFIKPGSHVGHLTFENNAAQARLIV